MAASTGSEGQFGFRFSRGMTTFGEDIWQGPVNKFARFMSMDGTDAQFTFTPIENMDPSNQTTGGDPTQATVSPKLKLNPDVNTMVPFIAHHCGKDAVISTPAGGTTSRQWVMTPHEFGDAAPASWLDSMILECYDGQECSLIDGARMQDLNIKVDQGKNVTVDLGFLACGQTTESDATQILVGTYSAKPIITGERAAALAGSTLKVKVTAIAGGGNNGTVKWTVGAYAGSTTIPIVFGKRYRVVLDDGTSAGVSREQDLWFCFPATSPATALALNDEWSFSSTRTPATPTFSTRRILKSTGFEVTVGGVEYLFHSGEVKITRPRKGNFVAGRMFATTIQKGGKWKVAVSLDRDRDDTDFVKMLRRAQSFTMSIKMYGLPIEGNIVDLWQIDLNCKVASVQRGVPNENTLQEKIEIMGERSGSTDIVTHTVVCSLTSL